MNGDGLPLSYPSEETKSLNVLARVNKNHHSIVDEMKRRDKVFIQNGPVTLLKEKYTIKSKNKE